MAEGGKEAFCSLLWAAQGRGYCTRPYDCRSCALLQQELAHHPQHLWVCPSCISELILELKDAQRKFFMPGYYHEGSCEYLACPRPARQEGGASLPSRFSRFLMLVLLSERA